MIPRSIKAAFKQTILCLFLVSGFAVHVRALTVGDIEVQVRRLTADKAEPTINVTEAEIFFYVNEAQRDIVNRSWCLKKTSAQALTARTTYYSLPDDMLGIQEFTFQETTTGRKRQLEEKSQRGLYQDNPDYERQTGPPFYYFVRHSTSTGTALEYGINPVPSTSTALGTVFIEYYNQPATLTATTDIPLGGFKHLYPYHSALVWYVSARLLWNKGDPRADMYTKMYEASVALMLDRMGRMPNYNPGFSGGSK